jgi:hypothetical protein
MLSEYKCPLCGASGKLWNKDPETFMCLRCTTFFSKFGVVLESEEDNETIWT